MSEQIERSELELIGVALEIAKEYDLEVEVIFTALEAMKYDSRLTVVEAINFGLNEWVK